MIQLYLFFLVLALFVLWNWYLISVRQQFVNHTLQEALRTVCWVAMALAFEQTWLDRLTYLGAYYCAFWFPFNTALNLLRGEKWNYVGHGPNAAWTDNIIYEYPGLYPMSIVLMIAGLGALIFGTYY